MIFRDFTMPAKTEGRCCHWVPLCKRRWCCQLATDSIALSKGGFIIYKNDYLDAGKGSYGGFVCYKKEVLETINLDQIVFVGYAFQIEMKFAAWKLGFKLKEVPIIFQDRTQGTSKMNKGIVKEGVLGVLKLRWLSLFKNYRRRVKNTGDTINTLQQNKIVAEGK